MGAALSAVRVASAQVGSTVADKLCELGDIALRQGIDIPAARYPVVEAPGTAAGFAGEVVRRSRRRWRPRLLATRFPAVHHEDDHQG